MSLRTEMERSGRWLFQNRGHLPLLLVPLLLLELFQSPLALARLRPDWRWDVFCFLLSLAGLLLRGAIVGFVPGGTSGRLRSGPEATVLNTAGFYSLMRHPLYFANLLMWLGVVLFPGSIHFAVIVCLAYWVYYERIMFAEEAYLRRTFGDRFDAWAARTPAFLPLGSWQPAPLELSMRTVLRREASGWLAVTTIFPALVYLRDYAAFGGFVQRPAWLILFAFGVLSWLLLRVLRKRGMLAVEGR
jgi:protein-S-isoprenylcysteine O-methyltransferase Ste14